MCDGYTRLLFLSLSLSSFHIINKKKKKSNSPHTEGGPISERKKWKRVSVSQPCRTYRGAAAARALEGSAASRQEQPATPYMVKTPPPTASHSDSASPVGLEFWLPGKISVLGERGLSFACSHPSCATRKGPPYPPLLCTRNNLHWWSAFARVCLAGEAAAAPFFQGVGFRLGLFFLSSSRFSEEEEEVLKVLDAGASGMWALWEQHHPQTQTTAIDFSVNSTKKNKKNERGKKRGREREKKTKRNNSNTHIEKKILVYWTIHFFSPPSLWIPL